tara:strand:+ start:166 stop:630 length:465 start_codon:yes stop_codon:yes gene_type:complete
MATLTVTHTESLTLNGSDEGKTNTQSITGINDVYKRIVTCTNDVDTTVAVFKAAANTGDSAVDIENVKYIRITNLDSADPVHLCLQVDQGVDGADDQATIHLAAKQSFIMGKADEGISATDDATVDTTLFDLESIIAHPTGADTLQVEIFIATT